MNDCVLRRLLLRLKLFQLYLCFVYTRRGRRRPSFGTSCSLTPPLLHPLGVVSRENDLELLLPRRPYLSNTHVCTHLLGGSLTHSLTQQCDQMARLFFVIWLLTTVQIAKNVTKLPKVG